MQGRVKFFDAVRGYGFITADTGAPEIFVHITAVQASKITTLLPGDAISFETEPSPKGPRAININLLNI